MLCEATQRMPILISNDFYRFTLLIIIIIIIIIIFTRIRSDRIKLTPFLLKQCRLDGVCPRLLTTGGSYPHLSSTIEITNLYLLSNHYFDSLFEQGKYNKNNRHTYSEWQYVIPELSQSLGFFQFLLTHKSYNKTQFIGQKVSGERGLLC